MGDRLLWRCRRGMRELDKLVEGYYLSQYAALADPQKQAFEALLEEADPDILSWLMRREAPPAQYVQLIEAMREHGKRSSAA